MAGKVQLYKIQTIKVVLRSNCHPFISTTWPLA